MRQFIIIAGLLLLSLDNAFSQGEDQMLPVDKKQLTIVTEPATLERGFLRTGLTFYSGSIKKIFNENSEREIIPGASAATSRSIQLAAAYGITDRFEARLYIPYMLNTNESVLIVDDPVASQQLLKGEIDGYGLGDISLGLHLQLLKEKASLPSITLAAYAELPTGRKDPTNVTGFLEYDEATGSGEFSASFEARIRKIAYPFSFEMVTGGAYHFGGTKVLHPGEDEKSFKSGHSFHAIAGINFHLNDWISVTNDVQYMISGASLIEEEFARDDGWGLTYIPNIQFQIKRLRLAQGLIIPVIGRNQAADPYYIIIVQYLF